MGITISIIGSGALGKTYGGVMALAGHNVHFLLKSEFESIQEAGFFELNFIKSNSKLKVETSSFYFDPAKLPRSDLVIISLKTTQNAAAVALIQTCLKKETVILIIQNGIGNEEYFSSIFPNNPIICGVSTFGATREDPLHVQIHNAAELRLAPFKKEDTECCKVIHAHFQKAFKKFFPEHCVKTFDDYKTIRWNKILWNAVFGPLTIIYDEPGNVLVSVHKKKIIDLMGEIKEVALKEGVIIEDEYMKKIIRDTQHSSNYYPSMYIDYEKGMEIEKKYLLDNILEIASLHDLNIPSLCDLNKKLSCLIKDNKKKNRLKNQNYQLYGFLRIDLNELKNSIWNI